MVLISKNQVDNLGSKSQPRNVEVKHAKRRLHCTMLLKNIKKFNSMTDAPVDKGVEELLLCLCI